MAITAKPTIGVSINFRDDDAKNASCEVLIPGATTAANALAFAASFAPLVAACSDSTLTGYNVIFGFAEAGALVIGSSDIENKGVILLNAANAVKTMFTIPSPLESILQANNADIDPENADVSALLDALTLGISSVQPVNNSGSDLTSVRAAYKQNRESHVSGRTRKG